MKNLLLYKTINKIRMGDIYSSLFLNKTHCVILAYHKILPLCKDTSLPDMVVDPIEFESQVKYLKENYEIIALSQLESFFNRNQNKKSKAAVITFDDGYEDNYNYALPVLKKYSIPATIFVSTAFIETKKAFWGELLDFMLRKTNLTNLTFKHNNREYVFKTDAVNKLRAAHQIADLLKFADTSTQEGLLNRIAKLLQVEIADFSSSFLSWNQMQEMQNNNICFGAHTHNHQWLIGLDEKKLIEELRHPKELLENRLGREIEDFAYPYGEARDINERIKNMLHLAGYKRALTMIQGCAFKESDSFCLKRIGLGGNDNSDILKLKLKGAIPFLRKYAF